MEQSGGIQSGLRGKSRNGIQGRKCLSAWMWRYLPVLFFVLAVAWQAARAQSGQATLTGNVYDPSGAVIPGAKVTITNVAQGTHFTAVTNSAGAYSVPGLNPGIYQVQAEARGFKIAQALGVIIEVGETARQNLTLQPGAVATTVRVSASAVSLDTDDSTVGQVIQNRTVVGLPLINRNYLQLSLLTVGVAPAAGSRSEAAGNFSALGEDALQTRVLLDGAYNSSRESGGELGYEAQIVTPSVDAVQAFKVVTDNSSAEYGYGMGGTVVVSTKSGTNQFHGTAYEFLRNNALDAANYFSAGQAVPPYHRNEFGGVLGGPIRRDKTFFFVSVDATRISEKAPTISTVPTPAMLKGDFQGFAPIYDPKTTTASGTRTQFPGNMIKSTRFDSVAENLIPLFPAPNLPGVTNSFGVANNFYYDSPSTDTPTEIDARVDQTFNQRFRGFVRYSHRTENQTVGGPLPLPADGAGWTTLGLSANSAVANFSAAISPDTYDNAVVAFSNLYTILGIPETQNENTLYGLNGLPDFGMFNQTGLAEIDFSGYASIGSHLANPNENNLDVAQVSDNLFLVRGRHTITTGFALLGEQVKRLSGKNARGSIAFTGAYTEDTASRATTGSPIADFLLGDIQTLGVSNLVGETATVVNYSAFVQDNWHMRPRLTVNLGLRWDLFGRPTYGHTPVDIFEFTPGSQNYQIQYPHGTRDCGCTEDWKNFAPRVGFEYQVHPGTVIRSGFALLFGEADGIQDTQGGFFNQSPFFDKIALKGNELTKPAGILANGFPAENYNSTAIPPKVNVDIADTYMPTQYTEQRFADLEQRLGNSATFTLSYLGSETHHLVIQVDTNQPPPGPGSINSREPHPYFDSIDLEGPVGNAAYNAFTAKLDRRFADGFMLLGSYTWAHAIDNVVENLNDTAGEGIQNNYDLAAERGNSIFDLRNYFVASALYTLPFGRGQRFLNSGGGLTGAVLGGWQLGGIVTLHSGSPFTPYLSTDTAETGTTIRPNRIGSGLLPPGQRSINDWFNVADFPIPAPYTFGDSGRDILTGPGLRNVDLKIGKDFNMTGRAQMHLRAEFFNALNTPPFGAPNSEVDLPNAGTITTAGAAREIQLALKLTF